MKDPTLLRRSIALKADTVFEVPICSFRPNVGSIPDNLKSFSLLSMNFTTRDNLTHGGSYLGQ